MINNKAKILPYLVFGKNTFYIVQCIQRRKDNPDMEKETYQRGYWYITSLNEFEIHWPRMLKMAEYFNARIYISVCPRSLEKLAKQAVVEYGQRIISGDYTGAQAIPQKIALSPCVLEKGTRPKPIWVVDVDDRDHLEEITKCLREINVEILNTLPTQNGYHVLVNAFNIGQLKSLRVNNKRNDYKLKTGQEFSILSEGNTILFIN